MKKIAFLTTIFPQNKDYLHTFIESLKQQTYKNFDIIVVNDNYEDFEEIKRLYDSDLNIIELKYSDTIAKNREYGINYCISNGYDIIIFGDSDDYFANNRVEKSIELLERYDIVVNDLSLFNDNGVYEENYISYRLNNLSLLDYSFIRNKNIFGFTNTALRLIDVKSVNIPEDLIAIDWYLFSILLLEGKSVIFTNDTVTYYRQHPQNTAGLGQINVQTYMKCIDVKKRHFLTLNRLFGGYESEISYLYGLSDFDIAKLLSDANRDKLLWWELI
ncbi:hypothetical protein JZK55_12580 [Dissulfurispira thermophila]|uniref:Glycosyltransferase 2-like domain-containing protein n=1 Tax=Dissulfurispira thermophila TaxID=2715679 RepID=A0A7G1H314_9BACT|nr:glycosyltransferase [Dissulfurispira thermophila]BCB96336.1 hypothetical protein JZK55_12580 [Dissulfurispira thermophila]